MGGWQTCSYGSLPKLLLLEMMQYWLFVKHCFKKMKCQKYIEYVLPIMNITWKSDITHVIVTCSVWNEYIVLLQKNL